LACRYNLAHLEAMLQCFPRVLRNEPLRLSFG
jgi:hypothetical protein